MKKFFDGKFVLIFVSSILILAATMLWEDLVMYPSLINQYSEGARVIKIMQILALILVLAGGFYTLYRFNKKVDKYEHDSNAQTRFLSNVSREIRNPISAIISLCRMAEQTDDINVIKHQIEIISMAASHLIPLVDDVLDLSDIESGKIEFSIAAVSLRNEIEGIRRLIETRADERSQKFSINISNNTPEYVYCDAGYIRQVLVSFLSNALKYTNKNGEVCLDITVLEQKTQIYMLEFSISDNGTGKKQWEMSRMFQPFEQGEDIDYDSGVVLSLSIAKRIVELMGGEVEVVSDKEKGSICKFNLWLMEAYSEEVEVSKPKKLDLSGKYVMMVEDSEVNQIVEQDLLAQMGAKVEFVPNGVVCYAKYLRNPRKYDLIFMDISMPVVDGYKIAGRIRSSNLPNSKTVPIIAMVPPGEEGTEDKEKAVASGLSGYVAKPFDASELEKVVGACLDNAYGEPL